MNEIIHAMLEQVRQMDEIHALLFRAHHPNRKRFSHDGRLAAVELISPASDRLICGLEGSRSGHTC